MLGIAPRSERRCRRAKVRRAATAFVLSVPHDYMLDTNWRGDDALDSQCTDEKMRLQKNQRKEICVNEKKTDEKMRLRKNERTKIWVNEKEPDEKMRLQKMNGRNYA